MTKLQPQHLLKVRRSSSGDIIREWSVQQPHIYPVFNCSDANSCTRLSVLCWQDDFNLQPNTFDKRKWQRERVCVYVQEWQAGRVVVWWMCKLYPLISISQLTIWPKYPNISLNSSNFGERMLTLPASNLQAGCSRELISFNNKSIKIY